MRFSPVHSRLGSAFSILFLSALHQMQAAAPARPNIIVILSDDMGYSDLGCYGSEIQTPNLDALAANGLRYTQFYNAARCCPSRASLLTGLYPHQAGMGSMTGKPTRFEGYQGDLSHQAVTMAEVLRGAGYGTYMTGKWHLTGHDDGQGPKDNWPLQRGFQRFYGVIRGAGSFFDPGTLTRDNELISPFADPEYKPATYYFTDAITDHSVRFIQEHKKQHASDPFFLYVAYTAAHWPMHALPEDIAKYRGKYDGGYGPVRQARFERLKKLGLIDPKWELSPQFGDWEKFPDKAWEARCMEVYAAMVDRMDQGIGKIVATLKKEQLSENTLILFLEDNGACHIPTGRKPGRPNAPMLAPIAADAIRLDETPKQDRQGVPTKMGPQYMPGPGDTYISYGEAWANVSNTPFRLYKRYVHEGGISTPLVAYWPKGIQAKGKLDQQPGHLIDIMATCVEVSGAKYPAEFNGNKIKQMEGRSLVPSFAGRAIEPKPLCWEHLGNRAIRMGDWKLVTDGIKGPWELYNMASDRTEMHDLAAADPQRVQSMAAAWEEWAKRTVVIPGPAYKTAR